MRLMRLNLRTGTTMLPAPHSCWQQARRRRDVAEWIRQGVAAGEGTPCLSEDAIAGQFSASIVGIVYPRVIWWRWLHYTKI